MSDRDIDRRAAHERSDRPSELERRTKQAFDASAAALDAATRSRLTRARERALAGLDARRPTPRWWLVPAAALGAAAVAAALLVVVREPVPPIGPQVAQDLEILLGEEDLEMLDEEIGFYAWLEEQPELAEPAASDGVG